MRFNLEVPSINEEAPLKLKSLRVCYVVHCFDDIWNIRFSGHLTSCTVIKLGKVK